MTTDEVELPISHNVAPWLETMVATGATPRHTVAGTLTLSVGGLTVAYVCAYAWHPPAVTVSVIL